MPRAGAQPEQSRPPERHVPVLLAEVLAALEPRDGAVLLDGTFGAGGYTRALLHAARCRVLAIDRDPTAIAGAAPLQEELQERLILRQGCFGDLDAIATAAGVAPVDGVVLDIGVSSMQLDEAERGFSFQADGPLDMRMAADGPTAADVVNGAGEGALADILFHLGEERRSRAIARAVVARRARRPFARTLDLADVVARVLGGRSVEGRHPATRTFQALRIYVNDELGELARGLAAAERILKPGGRLAVVTFHSLEDRIVKRFLAERAGRTPGRSRHLPQTADRGPRPSFRIVNSKPLTPSKAEIDANPRARSARLRSAERLDAPALPLDLAALDVPQPGA